ncbi:MAG: DNA gyrase inhibitor YacG [Acidobacteriota bacterium]
MSMKCPVCKTPVVWEGNPCRPFCSDRCQLIDLGNWASGAYAIPVKGEDSEEAPESEVHESS